MTRTLTREGPGAHPVTPHHFRREAKEAGEGKGPDHSDTGHMRRCWAQDPGAPETQGSWRWNEGLPHLQGCTTAPPLPFP